MLLIHSNVNVTLPSSLFIRPEIFRHDVYKLCERQTVRRWFKMGNRVASRNLPNRTTLPSKTFCLQSSRSNYHGLRIDHSLV